MKLPRQKLEEILDGLIPLLLPVNETTERVRKVKGETVIKEGITQDQKGKPINRHKMYVVNEPVTVPVNHRRRIKNLIEQAATMKEMEDLLAAYLVKFGRSKEDITKSIYN